MKLTAPTLSLLTLLFLYSCKDNLNKEDYTGFVDKEFDLSAIKDSAQPGEKLAHIKIKVPSILDTFYQWHRESDCSNCGKMEYRFSSKNYPQFAESGVVWTNYPDSVFQLTFIHEPIVKERSKFLDPVKIEDTAYLPNYLANQSTWCDKFSFLYKKHVQINSRNFVLTAFTTDCSIITNNKPTILLGAITSLKNTSLLLLAETNAKDTTGFEMMMRRAINSIEISE